MVQTLTNELINWLNVAADHVVERDGSTVRQHLYSAEDRAHS